MKILKGVISLIIVFSMMFCLGGCDTDEFDGFVPTKVRVVDYLRGSQNEVVIEDSETTQKLWQRFKDLYIDTDTEGEMGSSYLYLCFYNDDQSTLAIFTIYDNGSCCLGEDFKTFYTVRNGYEEYNEMCNIYTNYDVE